MKSLFLVALGGSMGAVSRWALGSWLDRLTIGTKFPVGIFAANALGCLVIGILFGLAEGRGWISDANLRLLVFTGFLGSFTTFSTFSWNTFELFKSGNFGVALANVFGTVLVCLLAVWAGYSLVTSTANNSG